MSTHAKLSASAAHRWMHCAGSVKLSRGLPNPGSRNAAEGTFAHEIAASALNGVQKPALWLGKKRIVDDKFEIECTQEMVDAVCVYIDEIDDEMMPMDTHFVEVDLTLALAKIHPSLGGTADFIRYRPGKKHLRVVDLKYGAGVIVEVEDNVQAMVYALGALLTSKQPCAEVTVTIIQPRAEHPDGRVRDWTFPSADLLDFEHKLVMAAKATEAPDAPLVPGAKQCQWCLAKPTCPALRERQDALMVNDYSEPATLAPEKLASALLIFPAVKARIKAIEEAAYAAAEAGIAIPGFKLVDKRPMRQWIDIAAVEKWALEGKLDLYAPRELLSPAQAEKCLAEVAPKGKKKEAGKVLEPFYEKKSSGHALVPATDDRPAVKRLEDNRDFAAIGGAADANHQPPTATINLF